MSYQTAQSIARNALGLPPTDAKRYSLSRAILAASGHTRLSGLEAECHNEIVRRTGHETVQQGGVFIPSDVQFRDMTVGTASAGGNLVGTELRGADFIDLLRNRLVIGQMGATILSGLKGNIAIPKMTASGTGHWLTNEATSITESQQTLAQVTLSPKNVGALTEFSRQLLLQSSPAIDSLIANDLSSVLALAIDTAAISGSGSSGQPLGLLNTAGIGSVTGTSLGYAGILELISDLANSNVLDGASSPGFVTTPAIAALLAQRVKVAGTYSPLWEGNTMDGRIDGFRAMTSNQIAAGTIIFADWAQLLIGEWGQLEIASNPFSGFSAGTIQIRAIQTVDVGVRYAEAFSRATSVT